MFSLLWNKPKPERFSLDSLISLCRTLQSFPADTNEDRIVTCLKELTQLLVWGDQHDPKLLEHFFEQNVHWHFLKILQTKHEASLIIQVLQTLNIMFENVRSRESLYFLLSNNYVNQVICLKYDFSNDEIIAYYIYLLRTLSFKLSKDTIYFFFNEHLEDFPLYSEAIKFFNHDESMIRIAVRVITLNVYSVNDRQMQEFILERTTSTYFSNLVWFTGHYGTTINDMLLHPGEGGESSRINYYLAEHMDCFYYVNDIIELDVPKLNKMLISHLLNRLLRPMYLDCLLPANAQSSTTNKSSSTNTKLMPLVALSLMLHAFHVLKHAPLVSALASTLFSNQLYSSNQQNNTGGHHPHTLLRHTPSPLVLGPQSVSPESSRPASPVTSKFHSFGLLGTSPAAFDSNLSTLSTSTPSARFNLQRSATPPTLSSPSFSPSLSPCIPHQQSQNPYKASIYEYLGHVHSDRLVLPALMLIYLAGRNSGVMSDVLLGTDIYPQRLLKSKQLMGNLMSSVPPRVGSPGIGSISKERSEDLMSPNSPGSWSVSSPRPVGPSASIFGAAVSATGGRMRTKTESPLFEVEEYNEESRETEELLASEDSEALPPQGLSPSIAGVSARIMSSSLPSPAIEPSRMSRNRSAESDSPGKAKPIVTRRRGKTALGLLGPILPSVSHDAPKKEPEGREMIQELRPVSTSKQDRDSIQLYPSGDEDDAHGNESAPTSPSDSEDRLVDIICGQPESGAHRFRILTIQVATELLLELVLTKASSGASVKEGNSAMQQAAEVQLGEIRLQRLALAEAQFRERVQKGIRELESQKKSDLGQSDTVRQPLVMLTGRVERALTESKLGIDKLVVNIITEANMVYGPDSDPTKEPDLDPDPELMLLFDLDPEYTTIKHEKVVDDDKALTIQIEQSATGLSSTETDKSGKRSRSRVRDMFFARMQGIIDSDDESSSPPLSQSLGSTPKSAPLRRRLTKQQRLEAMVIRYMKWLHLLTQCRQLVCRKAGVPTTIPTTGSAALDRTTSGTPSACMDSPTILISESPTTGGTPTLTPTLLRSIGRPPSELMDVGSFSGAGSARGGLQKSSATTATTTVLDDSEVAMVTKDAPPEEPLSTASLTSCPSTETDSAMDSTLPSPTSSISSSFSSTLPSPYFTPMSSVGATSSISATLSQPASGSASGRIIGSRPLLSATAALEAAQSANHHGHGSGVAGSPHPFLNDVLANHLDPLSASVSEVIRKSGDRIKKSVVDPLATSPLFKSSPLSPPILPTSPESPMSGRKTAPSIR
ncbi:Protein CL16A, partial [Mortierella sp. NVP85]